MSKTLSVAIAEWGEEILEETRVTGGKPSTKSERG
jgi:hypothetical protein